MSDYRILTVVVLLALLADAILETPLIILGASLLLYTIWLIYKIHELEQFSNNIKSKYAPASDGKIGNIIRNILQLNKQVKIERSRSQRIISRLNEVLRNFPYPTIMLNQYGQITWMDKNAAKLFKLRRKADVGIKLNNILRNASLGELLERSDSSELPIISPTDSESTLLLSISKLANDTRIITILDISTRVKLMNMQQEFISNASHELRTPLTVINGYLEALTLETDMDERYQTMISEAYNQAQLMSSVISDLLDLSTIQHEHASITTVHLCEVVDKVVLECTPMLSGRSLVSEIHPEITLTTSFFQLYTLVKNLVDNAIKYTNNQGNIQIIATKHSGISLSVIDDGIGIASEHIEHITQPFYRVHSTQQGSGLGLNIVDKIVAANNAELRIESKLGSGSIFTVIF